MSDDGLLPDVDHPQLTGIIDRMVSTTREAFGDEGAIVRQGLLGCLRSASLEGLWRGSVDDLYAKAPEKGRGEALRRVRALWMAIFERVASASGLDDWQSETYLAAVVRGFDRATRGEQPMSGGEV